MIIANSGIGSAFAVSSSSTKKDGGSGSTGSASHGGSSGSASGSGGIATISSADTKMTMTDKPHPGVTIPIFRYPQELMETARLPMAEPIKT